MWKNAFLILIGTFLLFHPPVDPDFGWHYKYGEHIFQKQQILKENVFSFTFENYHWANSYWIAEIILYTLYIYVGPIGMSFILSLTLSIFAMVLLDRAGIKGIGKIPAILLFFIFMASAYTTIRPFYFSTIFLLTLSYILIYKKHWQIFLPLMFLVWANTHADFTLGLFIYAVFMCAELYQNKFNNFIKTISLPFLSLIMTLINPYGIKLWETLLKETHYFQFNHIMEWLPINVPKENPIYAIVIIIMASFLYAGIISAYLLDKKKVNVWYLIVSSLFFALSYRSVYFLRILSILALLPMGFFLNFALTFIKGSLKPPLIKPLKILALGFAMLGLLISTEYFIRNTSKARDTEAWSKTKEYPYQAVTYIKENNLQGNVFNSYNWGGYLIWQLPNNKVFIDGRMPSWRDENKSIFEDYVKITDKPDENMELLAFYLESYNIKYILYKPNSKLVNKLLEQGEWKNIYEDSTAILLSK